MFFDNNGFFYPDVDDFAYRKAGLYSAYWMNYIVYAAILSFILSIATIGFDAQLGVVIRLVFVLLPPALLFILLFISVFLGLFRCFFIKIKGRKYQAKIVEIGQHGTEESDKYAYLEVETSDGKKFNLFWCYYCDDKRFQSIGNTIPVKVYGRLFVSSKNKKPKRHKHRLYNK